MGQCKICGSWAINPTHHWRSPNTDLDLCDVCYWHKRSNPMTKETSEKLVDDLIEEVQDDQRENPYGEYGDSVKIPRAKLIAALTSKEG